MRIGINMLFVGQWILYSSMLYESVEYPGPSQEPERSLWMWIFFPFRKSKIFQPLRIPFRDQWVT